MPGYSVIVPVHDNATTLPELRRRVDAVFDRLATPYELILVDDASNDDSWAVISELATADDRVIGVRLAHNVRQTRAIFAGIEVSTVGPFVMLDADLEDPPDAIADLIAQHRAGHDLVIAKRRERRRSAFRRLGSAATNRVLQLGGVPVADLGSSFLLAARPLEHPVRAQLHRTGTQLVLPAVVSAASSPRWIEVEAPDVAPMPSGYSTVAVVAMARDAVGTWIAPVAARRAAVGALAGAAIVAARRGRSRVSWIATAVAALTAVAAQLTFWWATHPTDELYRIAEQVGPGAASDAGARTPAEDGTAR